ncbi:MAG: hypothetical protein ACXWLB_03145, partial [Reyranella sp.]
MAKLERSVKAIDTDAAALEKRAAAIRKQLLSQQIDPETFFAQSKALDGERQALANRRKGLSDEASSLRGEAEATVARMVTEMPTEMEATFHSKNPKEILARGHMVEEGSLSASGMFSVFNAVMMAVDIIDGVQYVLDADSVMEGVGRFFQLLGMTLRGLV